ncbi:MAG: hypothetical protein U0264_17885 [Candidatus Kapaibacterium sp.]
MKILKLLLLGIFVLLSSNSQKVFAQSSINVEIKVLNNIDICGNKTFQLFIQTDEIYAADSIVGFDLYLGYNSEKIQIDQMLTAGTISSQLQNAGSEAVLTINKTVIGEVWLSGAFFSNNKFLKGKQPLIALTGRYIKDCSDTTMVTLLEYIPAYYDFSKLPPQVLTKDLTLRAEVPVNGTREFKADVKEDRITIGENDSTRNIRVFILNDDIIRTNTMDLVVYSENKQCLHVQSIESLQNECKIDTSYLDSDTLHVRASWKNTLNLSLPVYNLKVQRTTVDHDSSVITLKVKKITDCNCINQVRNDSIKIEVIGKKVGLEKDESGLPSNVEPEVTINKTGHNCIIRCNKGMIFQIMNSDLLGRKVWKLTTKGETVELSEEEFSYGINLLEISIENQEKVTKKLIKYIK